MDGDFRRTVVIVDDDPAFRDLCASALHVTAPGTHVITCHDARTAKWELSRLDAPVLLICDEIMPGEAGSEFMKALDRREGDRHILLSGAMTTDVRRQAVVAGVDMLCEKPFDYDHLERMMMRIVDGWNPDLQVAATS